MLFIGKTFFIIFSTRLSNVFVTTTEQNNPSGLRLQFQYFFLARRDLEGTGNGMFVGFGF